MIICRFTLFRSTRFLGFQIQNKIVELVKMKRGGATESTLHFHQQIPLKIIINHRILSPIIISPPELIVPKLILQKNLTPILMKTRGHRNQIYFSMNRKQ